MKFMVLVPANADTEASVMPTTEELAEMGEFNERLAEAGMMVAGDGLHPTSKGARIQFGDGEASVIDGPFSESKELIAGYWIIQCDSLDVAKDWMKQAPFPAGTQLEIRQVFEAEDFGDALTPEIREQEGRIRANMETS